MRRFLFVFLLSVMGSVPKPLADQTPASDAHQPIVRAQLVAGHEDQTSDDCVVVLEGGEFHREHRIYHPTVLASGRPGAETIKEASQEVKVFEGRLSDEELAKLREVLDNPSLRDIPDMPKDANRHVSKDEAFSLSVSRSGGKQHLAFFDTQSRAPYKNQLAPVLKWLNGMKKHPATEIPAVKATRCAE